MYNNRGVYCYIFLLSEYKFSLKSTEFQFIILIMKVETLPEEIKREIERLVEELNYHCYRYYVLDSPVISDEEYDRLYRRLKELEEKYNYVLPHSPTQRVGAPPLDKFEKVRHKIPMLSLDNAFNYEEVREFDERTKRFLGTDAEIEYTVEPKYDGLAIELTYRNGMLYKASTRGDGYEGEDVTQNIKTIKSVPLKIAADVAVPEEIDIRGEVYMNVEDFEELNKSREAAGESLFANPRNAAAGSVRQLDPSVTASRKLHLACYGVGAYRGIEFSSQWEFIQWLKKARFPVPAYLKLCKGINEVLEAIEEISEKKSEFPFETDGVVIKVNSFELQSRLGVKTREPRWAIAYKFPAHQGTTVIKEVIPSVGRTGIITPVAIFEPVRIGGVIVSRSTLHNWDEIKRKDIRIGDTVVVERAGEVIPHVVMVVKDKRTGKEKIPEIPERCPVCGSKVVRPEGEVAVRCIGLDCPAQVKERLKHFASRNAMDIEGLGDKNIELLYKEGLIKSFVDIYRLKKEDLLRLPRFAEKSAQNLIDAIQRSKNTTLSRFLFALGILFVGEYTAKLLARHFRSIEDLYHVSEDRLLDIPQIGEKIARSVAIFFNDKKNLETLEELKRMGLKISNPDYREEKAEQPLKGLTFVITGTLPKPRKEVEEMIEALGGHAASSVSSKTDYLIVGDSPGSKLRKAEALGVKTITYDEFLKMVGEA